MQGKAPPIYWAVLTLLILGGCNRASIPALQPGEPGRSPLVFQTGVGDAFVPITGLGRVLGAGSSVTSMGRNSDGTMWASLGRTESGGFADFDLARIGNDAAAHEFNRFAGSSRTCMGSGPLAITRDGSAWFSNPRVQLTANQICRISSSGTPTVYTVSPLAPYVSITHLAPAPDGSVWFSYLNAATIAGGQGLGHITAAGSASIYPLLSRVAVSSLASGPDGRVWFAANPAAPGALPLTGSVAPDGTISTSPHDNITFGDVVSSPDGSLYVSTMLAGSPRQLAIAALSTAGAFQTFPVSPAAGCTTACSPARIALGPFGNIWLGRPDGTIQAFSHTQRTYGPVLTTPLNAAATALANGGDDNLWLAGGSDGSGMPLAAVFAVRDITVRPLALTFSAVNTTQAIAISERYFTGAFSAVSSAPAVASVGPGASAGTFLVTLHSPGNATITLSDNGNATKSNAVQIPVTCTCQASAR